MTTVPISRDMVTQVVKRLLVAESRLPIPPAELADDEPLAGPVLTVDSLSLVGMLLRLEDELDVTIEDDELVGRKFRTVADLVNIVIAMAR